ncbi:ribosomal protein S8 [Suhomyces tanzawaensis NRRL Y-17324]|uniref:Ribosomal protein S8 n=1 Tax=Suhomyces tanzawaensis NRRL Y-17324 TaxID=984487 RepID=A0A1E4SJR0_9ASCO|nr:ribosomal protein S8 [Suhomyces tanzawaensis NRRL Y-17324]ODV79746.1 ribosomal protein S8 [Suhomyces tanzawaensis NRRL Y-17324]
MSLVHLANFCAHLKNCTNVNIATTSVPFSRLHLQAALGLYKEGFISLIQKGSTTGPDLKPVEVTPDNISTRRLWLGLKYRSNQPVIRDISLVSKPGRKVNLTTQEVKALASGLPVRFLKPLQPAESLFIRTTRDKEVIEIQEAAKKGVSGLALYRVK